MTRLSYSWLFSDQPYSIWPGCQRNLLAKAWQALLIPRLRAVRLSHTGPRCKTMNIGKPFAVGPEVPPERVDALRRALAQVYADQQFLAEARQAKLFVGFSPGQEVQRTVQELASMPPSVRERLKEIIK